jgi:MFS family permease
VSVFSYFKTRTFWLIGVSYFFVSYALYGITTFMVDYAKYQLQMPLEKASLLATIHGFCQTVGVLIVLPLSDYLGRKKTITISNTMITVALIGLLFKGNSWGILFFLVGLMAVFYGATFPIYGACAGDYFPRKVMGTIIGAWTPFYGLGAIATHWITGFLRDTTGAYQQAFFINSLMAALSIVFIGVVRKSR